MHDLKINPNYLDRILAGTKLFEVRKNDRDFQAGDEILFREYAPPKYAHDQGMFGERFVEVRITYVLHYPEALKEGYVVLGIQPKVGE